MDIAFRPAKSLDDGLSAPALGPFSLVHDRQAATRQRETKPYHLRGICLSHFAIEKAAGIGALQFAGYKIRRL